jgi:hypothetical protein
MTRRLTIETGLGGSASSRLVLGGSDKSAFSEVVMDFVGAWESLLQFAGSYYDWKQDAKLSPIVRWQAASASWPFLWHHLSNTAYFVASAVWNEDEIGAKPFQDALVRWPRVFEFKLPDQYYSQNSFLLFPDFFDMDWDAVEKRLLAIESDRFIVRDVNPFALFSSLLRRAHGDAILIVTAVMLRWYIEVSWPRFLWTPHCSMEPRRKEAHE